MNFEVDEFITLDKNILLTTWQVDALTVVDLTVDELTLDDLTWYQRESVCVCLYACVRAEVVCLCPCGG